MIDHYFFSSYLVLVLLCSRYVKTVPPDTPGTALYISAVWLTYCFIYLLPGFMITRSYLFLAGKKTAERMGRRYSAGAYLVAVGATTVTALLLFADQTIYGMFGFHVNGFVLNLVTTAGGIESMGVGPSGNVTFFLFGTAIAVVQIAILWVLRFYYGRKIHSGRWKFCKFYRYALALILVVSIGERVTYGVSHIRGYQPVLLASGAFPLYLPLTFRSLAEKFGVDVKRSGRLKVSTDLSKLTYPLEPLQIDKPSVPQNIVWLVAESWRWDMLDPEIMPATWAFSRHAHRFNRHFSGGNGTRMGLFSMFYGLYGPYWFSFLDERRSPVLMDVLQAEDYQFSMYTSAKFSYPEFDKTLFAGVPADCLHQDQTGPGWQRDRQNVTELLAFIEKRDKTRPFMSFMFFESPHARYYFPKESVIRKPYLAELNYAAMSLDKDIGLMKNRYINACHHLDSQFARVLDALDQADLLDTTMVVITGDHGEEFMEKGRWGHNSAFHQEQIRVPLVLWIPGQGSADHDQMTSHLDIAATLLPRIGLHNAAETYSLGYDLLGPLSRDFTVVSNWSRICIAGPDFKAVFPIKSSAAQTIVTTVDDEKSDNPDLVFKTRRDIFQKVLHHLARFKRKQ